MCSATDGRSDTAPGWCAEIATEAACRSHFSINIHSIRSPCVWLDVGCRASTTVGCIPSADSLPSGRRVVGQPSYIWVLWPLLLAMGVVVAVWLFAKKGVLLPRFVRKVVGRDKCSDGVRSQRHRSAEELERLHDSNHGVPEPMPADLEAAAKQASSAETQAEEALIAHALLAAAAVIQQASDNAAAVEKGGTDQCVEPAPRADHTSGDETSQGVVAVASTCSTSGYGREMRSEDADESTQTMGACEGSQCPESSAGGNIQDVCDPNNDAGEDDSDHPLPTRNRPRGGSESPELPPLCLKEQRDAFNEGDVISSLPGFCLNPSVNVGESTMQSTNAECRAGDDEIDLDLSSARCRASALSLAQSLD